MIDRVGTSITPTIYTDKAKVDAHKAEVATGNAAAVAANKPIDDQLAGLRLALDAKMQDLVKAADDQKAALQAEVDKLKAQVAELTAKKQPVVVVIGPTRFASKDEAETYIDQVKEAAKKAGARPAEPKPVEPPK